MTGSQTAQAVALVVSLVSAILALIAGLDPGGILSKPDIQSLIVGVFTAAVPLALLLWAYLHHDAATKPPPPAA